LFPITMFVAFEFAFEGVMDIMIAMLYV